MKFVSIKCFNIFQLNDIHDNQRLLFKSARCIWHRPTDLQTFLDLKHEHPQARIVVGNTEIGMHHANCLRLFETPCDNVPDVNKYALSILVTCTQSPLDCMISINAVS